jgi:Cu(I)/Ag(I) efflux system membrane fusion protein
MRAIPTLLLSSVLVGGFAAGRFLQVAAPAPAGAAARKILHWVDPMHPAYRSDKPGIAPDCGMQLEPVYEDGGPAGGASGAPRPVGAVSISGELRQLQGVTVGEVERAPSTQSLRLLGRVVPDERRVYSLNAAMEGSIREVSGVTAGSFVKKDQWLGAFFSADIRTPLQAYITALDVIAQDAQTRERLGQTIAAGSTPNRNARYTIERLRGMGMSTRQIEELARTRELPLTIDILAPVDGVVLARNVSLGQKFDKGAEWFRVANLDRVWVLADVAEADAALARPGAVAKLSLPGRPATLTAVVSRVPPQFDPASRTMKVRLELENPGAALRPEMFVDVELSVERPAALTIPADALVDAGVRKTVFVESGEGVYEPREVETGWRAGGRLEIARGLEAGERIVTSGLFLVDSESRIRAAAAGVRGTPAKDPVCGMEVDEAKARAAGKVAEHGGKAFAFCSETCKASFLASPERFAAAGHGGHDHAAHDRDALHASAGETR